jgi:hypothetical protein
VTPALGYTILAIAVAVMVGVLLFWALEKCEDLAPLPEPERRAWWRIENLGLGALAAGILIRLWFLYQFGGAP